MVDQNYLRYKTIKTKLKTESQNFKTHINLILNVILGFKIQT